MPNLSVIVTGCSSFIGAHLPSAFKRAGWDVIGTHKSPLDHYSSLQAQRLDYAARSCIAMHRLDITHSPSCRDLVQALRPTVWLHHAGWATDYAKATYNLNQAHTINVTPLEEIYKACAEFGTTVLMTGSSMEYGPKDSANRENEPCWPSTSYGLAKLTQTLRAAQLAGEYGVPTRVARVFIPFGPLDAPGKVMAIVQEALRQRTPVDLSPCAQRRDFIAVEDLVSGYVVMATHALSYPHLTTDQLMAGNPYFDLFNLCSGQEMALKDLFLEMASQLHADPALLRFGALSMRPGEPPTSFGDNSKAKKQLQWTPQSLPLTLKKFLHLENSPSLA